MSEDEYFDFHEEEDDFANYSDDDFTEITSQVNKHIHFDEGNNKRFSVVLLARKFPEKKVHYIILNLFTLRNDWFVFEERKGRFGVDKETKDEIEGNLETLTALFKSRFHEYTYLEWDNGNKNSLSDASQFELMPSFLQSERNTLKKKQLHELTILPSFLDKTLGSIINSIIKVNEITWSWKNETSQKADILRDKWLSKETIHEGLISLNNMAGFLESKMEKSDELATESYNFFFKIPHKDAEACNVLDRIDNIRNKIRVLEDKFEENHSESNMSIVSGEERIRVGDDFLLNPLDVKYLSFKNEITKLCKESNEYKILNEYFTETKMDSDWVITNIFRCDREDENPRLEQPYRLLWHGSSAKNICGILRNSLHRPKVGHKDPLQSRGVYFADCVAKSLFYCQLREGNYDDRFLFLFDVAMAKCIESHTRWHHDESVEIVKFNAMVFPKVKICESETGSEIQIGNPKEGRGQYGHFNEYIVYNEKLIRLVYFVQVSHVRTR